MKKVSANKLASSLNNVANNLNNNVRRVVKNEMAVNIIRVLIIIYTSFLIPMLNTNTLKMLNNNVVRLVVCALIVYLSFMDVITAVLLTIAFVLTIHQSNKKVALNNNNIQDIEVDIGDKMNNDMVNKINNITDIKVENYRDLSDALRSPSERSIPEDNNEAANDYGSVNFNTNQANVNANQANVNANQANVNANQANVNANQANVSGNEVNANQVNLSDPGVNVNVPVGIDNSPQANLSVYNTVPEANNTTINSIPENVSMDELNNKHPASSTMTDNILAIGAKLDKNGPVGLTTSQNLYDVSENAVPGADIMSQVVSVEGSLSAQGMNSPIGANYARSDGYPMMDGSGLVHEKLRNNAVNGK